MKKLKRGLAFLLSAWMLITLLPLSAFAADVAGTPPDETVQETIVPSEEDETQGEENPAKEPQEEETVPEEPKVEETPVITPDETPAPTPAEPEVTEPAEEEIIPAEPSEAIDTSGYDLNSIGFLIGGKYVAAEPSGIATFSMLPLETKDFNLDLSDYFPVELKEVQIANILDRLTAQRPYEPNPDEADKDATVAAYARWGYSDEDWNYHFIQDDFILVNDATVIDLSGQDTNSSLYMELVVGTSDQLDDANERYNVYVTLCGDVTAYDLFEAKAATTDRQAISSSSSFGRAYNSTSSYGYVTVTSDNWHEGDNAYLSLEQKTIGKFKDRADLTATVYAGWYDSEDAAIAAGATVLTDVWEQDLSTSGGHLGDYNVTNNNRPEFTVVLRNEAGTVVATTPLDVRMREATLSVSVDYTLADTAGNNLSSNFYTRDIVNSEYVYSLGYQYDPNDQYTLKMSSSDPKHPGTEVSHISAAYVGNFSTAQAAVNAGAVDIKTQLFDGDTPASGYKTNFSSGIDFTVFDVENNIHHFRVRTARRNAVVQFVGMYATSENSSASVGHIPYEYEPDLEHTQVILNYQYPVTGTYELELALTYDASTINNSNKYDVGYVAAAYEGNYATQAAAEAAGQVDIKDQLFPTYEHTYDARRGYSANYSEGKTFTIIDTAGVVHHLDVTLEAGIPAPNFPNSGTSLTVYSALDQNDLNSYDAWSMPYNADSYYKNGFQTLFMLNRGDNSAVADDTVIKPVFFHSAGLHVYRNTNELQTSGVSPVTFKSGEAIHYTVGAENGSNHEEYWITYVTPAEGAKLYVNGINEETHWDETTGIPVREVFLTEDRDGNYHDIFIANIGNAPLTDLSVTIENPQNILLDDYWTIREDSTKTLAAFDEISNEPNYAKNVAKIRLLRATDEDGKPLGGSIGGTLVISSGNEVLQKIKLSGVVGDPKILTKGSDLEDGVKYVHYSAMLQTNYMYGSGDLVFECTNGELPKGMYVKPNGEIYGVPQETGTFTFTVTAKITAHSQFSKNLLEWSDSVELTLNIADNTEENVWTATDEYPILEPIGEGSGYHYEVEIDGEELLHIGAVGDGSYAEFMNVYLDGAELTPDVDYTHEPGSTKITLREQTMNRLADGEHTISVEFRKGHDENGAMSKTAQKFKTINKKGSSNPETPSNPGTSNPSNPGTSNPGTSNPGNSGTTTNPGGSGSSSTTQRPRPSSGGTTTQRPITSEPAVPQPSTSPAPSPEPTPSPEPAPTESPAPEQTETAAEAFSDIDEDDWFYDDVNWVYQERLMIGIGNGLFAPDALCSAPMIFTVLARLTGADLSNYTDPGDSGIPAKKWYTGALVWAYQNDLLPEGEISMDVPFMRGDLAVVLVKWLNLMEIDAPKPETPAVFADSDMMSQEQEEAFQILYALRVFKGIGNSRMAVQEGTGRAQLAALIHRVSNLMQK